MKLWTKRIVGCAVMAFVLLSFSCAKTKNEEKTAGKNSNTVFADTSPVVTIGKDNLSVVEALQGAFRAVSAQVLPCVVEIDVVETRTRTISPMNGFPFNWFFDYNDGDDSEKKDKRTQEYKTQGLGSGVIVRQSGKTYYVLTNNHVADSATEITVKLNDGREVKGELVGADKRKDIALISFTTDDKSISVAKLGDSDTVQIGDICFAMGAPLGYTSSVTQGIVSATGRTGSGIGNINDFIQTDAAINQGNSGGPLVNIYGEIIGINTWIASQSGGSQGLGFSIPINNVKKAIDDFIKDGKITYGWMGVSLIEISKDYQKELGVEGLKGAFVSQIFLDSPASKGGLKAGDFVVGLNGNAVKSVDQLVREVGDLTVGETAVFDVLRGGKTISLTVKIDSRDDSVAADNSKLWPGFSAYPITEEILSKLNISDKKQKGVVVTSVLPKSPAAALSLQAGDIITGINDTPVSNIKEFYSVLAEKAEKEVWFDLVRDGHKVSSVKYKF